MAMKFLIEQLAKSVIRKHSDDILNWLSERALKIPSKTKKELSLVYKVPPQLIDHIERVVIERVVERVQNLLE